MPAVRRIDGVVAAMGARGAQAGLFEVLVLSSEPAGLSATPERGTNLVSETSVPEQMRDIVSDDQRQAWTYTTIRYTDGRTVPGFVVGAPLEVRGVGPYELYQLFPLTQEQDTLVLVRNSMAVAGLFIILGLAGLAVGHLQPGAPGPRGRAHRPPVLHRPPRVAHAGARRGRPGTAGSELQRHGDDAAAAVPRHGADVAVQQQFVADVSHELRTPMTTVRMAADLLHDKRHELPSDEARAVELLQNQLNRFEALLADLLETSRQDVGICPAGLRGRRPAPARRAGGGRSRPLADEMGCPVEVVGLARLVVPCDALRVERILGNLLTNAVEHGRGRPVIVVRRDGDGGPAGGHRPGAWA